MRVSSCTLPREVVRAARGSCKHRERYQSQNAARSLDSVSANSGALDLMNAKGALKDRKFELTQIVSELSRTIIDATT